MHTLYRQTLLFACCLAALAGFIDAIGFLQMGGFFASFMSGNSTRLAIGLQEGNVAAIGRIGGLIASFVAGTVLANSVRRRVHSSCRSSSVLMLIAGLLIVAIACEYGGAAMAAMLVVAAAMGASNMVIEAEGQQVVGVTYMTGTLVKMGQRIADALHGEARFAWMPYLAAWASLVVGGIGGAFLFSLVGLRALWFALAAVIGLYLALRRDEIASRLKP